MNLDNKKVVLFRPESMLAAPYVEMRAKARLVFQQLSFESSRWLMLAKAQL